MTTLKHSPAAGQALYRRKVEERAVIIRGRVEAMPGAGQQAKMDSVDNRIRLLHLAPAMDLMDQIDAALERHRQSLAEAEMAAAAQAQEQLLAERGVETVKVGPAKSRDGWQMLSAAGRLDQRRLRAGEVFRSLYEGAHRDGLSSANDNGTAAGEDDPIEQRIRCREKLASIRATITHATGSESLYGFLLSVCGRGETLRSTANASEARDKDRETITLEGDLRVALDMVIATLGIR